MRVRIEGPFEFRLPPAVLRRQTRALLLRMLGGWVLLSLLWVLVG